MLQMCHILQIVNIVDCVLKANVTPGGIKAFTRLGPRQQVISGNSSRLR